MKKLILPLFFFLHLVQAHSQTTIDTAVNFSAKDISGQTHILFDILGSGNLVLIDFFSTSCGPCATYSPEIQDSYEHFGMNSGNVYFMGISWGDDNQGVHIFDSTLGITYPSISGTQGSGNQINIAYNILSYPTIILILPDKSIKESHIWPPTTERIDSILIANGGITTGLISKKGKISVEKLWPNPAKDFFQASLHLPEPENISIEVIDMTGRVIQSRQDFLGQGRQVIRLSTKGLPPGSYLAVFKTDKTFIGSRHLFIQ